MHRSHGSRGPGRSPVPLPADPQTAAALLKIARAFNHEYGSGDYGPVYTRWDARSQAIISQADYIRRHKDCPGLRRRWPRPKASARRPAGGVAGHYEIGAQQLTDYWFYIHRRWMFDLVLSDPAP